VKRRVRHDNGGLHLVGDVNAVVSANIGGDGDRPAADSRQRVRIRQGSSRTGNEVDDRG